MKRTAEDPIESETECHKTQKHDISDDATTVVATAKLSNSTTEVWDVDNIILDKWISDCEASILSESKVWYSSFQIFCFFICSFFFPPNFC